MPSHAPRNVYRQQLIDPSVPPLAASQLLSIPSSRPRRKLREDSLDQYPSRFYGDAIIQKEKEPIRLFFQNVKGLSSTSGREDYRYYLTCLQALSVDIAGLSETNTCWSHSHLAYDFRSEVRKFFPQNKVIYGSPSPEVDPVPPKETFQSGGNLTMITGGLVSRVQGPELQDPTGLGRWNGVTLRGVDDRALTIFTAYRVCTSTARNAPLGSAFLREHDFLRDNNQASTNPRRTFLTDLQKVILELLASGHEIILMLDANSTLEDNQHFSDLINVCSLSLTFTKVIPHPLPILELLHDESITSLALPASKGARYVLVPSHIMKVPNRITGDFTSISKRTS